MPSTTTKRVYYVEPNYLDSYQGHSSFVDANGNKRTVDDTSKYEMAPPLEDYCVAFQLAVEVPTTSSNGTVQSEGKVFVLTTNGDSNSDSVSLLQGTRLYTYPQKKEEGGLIYDRNNSLNYVNYLTTAALDTTLDDIKKQSPTEMFGVRSIDINYESWMTPQVTIQFTDIRAASLFGPEELKHPNNGLAVDDIAGSFFRCFFMQPYPIFGLIVKGFYGEAVSYELQCSNFKYNLNSETGNYEAEAKFVGYTWGLLSDVTFNSIMAAPYDTYYGKRYWEDQVKANRFVIDRGNNTYTEMPTFPKVINAYRKLKEDQKAVAATDVETLQNERIKQESQKTDQNLITVNDSIASLIKVFSGSSCTVIGDNDGFIFITKVGNTNFAKVNDYENKAQTPFSNLKEICSEIGAQGFKSNLQFNKDKFKISDYNTVLGSAIKNGDNITLKINDDVYSSYSFQSDDINLEKLKKSPLLKNITSEPQNVYGIIVNAKKYKSTVNQKKQSLDEQKTESDKELKAKLHQQIAEYIGMPPTIYNMVKVMMAHLETLIHAINYCVNEIPQNRTIKSAKLDESNYHDFCSEKNKSASRIKNDASANTEDMVLPPFPKVRSKKMKEGRTVVEDDWLGDLSTSKELKEVNLIEGLLAGVQEMYADAVEPPATVHLNENGTKLELNVFCPIVPSDLFIPSKIYGNLDRTNPNELVGAAALRGAYLINAITDIGKNGTNAKVAGEIDAYNFCKQFGKFSEEWMNIFRTYKDGNDFYENYAKKIIFTSGSTANYPWQKKFNSALMTNSCMPSFPRTSINSTTTTFFPVYNINFNCEAYINGVTIDKNYSSILNVDGRELTYFDMSTSASLFSEVTSCFDTDDYIKEINNLKNIKDNFNELERLGQLNSEYANLYKDNYQYFTQTYSSASGLSDDVLKTIVTNLLIDTDNTRSYTFSPTRNKVKEVIDGRASAFKRGKDFNKNYSLSKHYYHQYDNNTETKRKTSDLTVERDSSFNIRSFIGEGMTVAYSRIIECTIPTFGGLELDNRNEIIGYTLDVSLFAQEVYINETNDYLKSQLFLYVINNTLDIKKCIKILFSKAGENGQNGFFRTLPYFFILYLGAYLSMKYDEQILKWTGEKHSHYKSDSKIWEPFKEQIVRWKPQMIWEIVKEYYNWVNGKSSRLGIKDYLTFKEIDFAFGLNKEALYAFRDLNRDTKEWGDDTVESILYKYIEKDSFFTNYVSLQLNAGEIKLFTRENTESIQKLAAMYVQPVLLSVFQQWPDFSGNNIRYSDGTIWEVTNVKDRLKSYLSGFFDGCSKLQGLEDNKNDVQGNPLTEAADIDKHIKISLYKYIHIMYRDWLSNNIWKSNGDIRDHWDIEPFFMEHFHFIDQFYVDCKDIFFNMDDTLDLWNNSFQTDTLSFLEFLTSALAKCQCTLYPVQNFLDYSTENARKRMDNLFRPIPFIEAFTLLMCLGKQQKMAQVLGLLRSGRSSRLLTPAWPSRGCCSHLGSESAHGEYFSVSSCLCVTLAFN